MLTTPCKLCLKFPICMNIQTVACKDLYVYLYTTTSPGYTYVDLSGRYRNLQASYEIETFFKKPILGIHANRHELVFGNRIIGERICQNQKR